MYVYMHICIYYIQVDSVCYNPATARRRMSATLSDTNQAYTHTHMYAIAQVEFIEMLRNNKMLHLSNFDQYKISKTQALQLYLAVLKVNPCMFLR
jgi:hypothetical protein